MAEHTLMKRCSHEGCKEWSPSSYSNRRDYNEAYSRYAKNGWKCARHKNPETILTPDNKKIVTEHIAQKSGKYHVSGLEGLYWQKDGLFLGGFGYGCGYRAFAKDFPEGTILRVTAEIILPD